MQYNKVEISGINTAELKLLTEDETKDLLRRTKEGDEQAREKLIQGNFRLVLSVLQKFIGRGESADDLFQVGVIGLIKAIDNFNIELNVKFSTYGVPMILGEVRRYLRDNQSVRVSRSMRDMAYKAMQAKEKLTAQIRCEPTVEQIAAEIGANRADVVIALESITDPVSLFEPIYSDSGDTLYVMDQISDRTDSNAALNEMLVNDAVSKLPERERNILALRYLQGKTQVEVAKAIGISQAQVSRLEKSAIMNIKNQIEAT
ncbi:RNA polymerase sporulation sigma factor SigG [Ruminococcus sp. 210702-SL.1.03]|jgi:RNA polymerase sporulation-specific sigma factor|uniref:RNA polymerase sporulation sigma factor SigG n=1 Tax=Ruminococcus sp. 210702-SL.1.03 TaxID=2883233 RepID=UPI001D0690A8|nr:RNA polymerase sporulation sigma factor SigG [Ruminococcus sp. 210702-SL.1.03]MCB6615460.1 RNA polymerase sporulation sigma factor SigG [Ruminococcus sp. 210702-SL.1.03]